MQNLLDTTMVERNSHILNNCYKTTTGTIGIMPTYPSISAHLLRTVVAWSLVSPLWYHGTVVWTAESPLWTGSVGAWVLGLRHLFFQTWPSAASMAIASRGSSTILPMGPVKSIATLDLNDSWNKDDSPFKSSLFWKLARIKKQSRRLDIAFTVKRKVRSRLNDNRKTTVRNLTVSKICQYR